MSENFINQVTLDYLINREQYNKHVENKNTKNVNKKDKKFYRKRVFQLTKDLLSKEEPNNLFPDVRYAFDNYVNMCVQYFKAIDNNDIIQSDYQNISDSYQIGANIPELNVDDILSQEEANKLLIRKIQMPNTLDSFVKRKITKKPDEMILPKQKDINLKDPTLKIKGVSNSSKKKNITNTYEENNKKKETDKKETDKKETIKNENK
jgi:hypothetical protein